jgi:tRNA-modifying protein YgfZ
MDSPLLASAGAVPAEGTDAGVAAHYGDPYAEQRALVRAAGQVDRSNRGILRITGEDRLSWLHSLTTQDLEHLAPGVTTEALVLSPQGHIEHHLTLTDDGTALWAHVEPGTAGSLLAFLQSMRFLLRVDPADVTGDFAVLTLMGPATPTELPDGTAVRMELPYGTDLIVARDRLGDISADLAQSRGEGEEQSGGGRRTGAGAERGGGESRARGREEQSRGERGEQSGVRLAGLAAYEALRIAAHRPRLGLDTDHRTLPHEVGWIETAVHLNKGCYRGQETVARVHNLGHPPRRLVFLHLDGSEDRLPAHGDPVTSGDSQVGFTGSVGRHFELGPIALGLIKRTVPVDAPLRAGGLPAAQEVVVPPDAGANVAITLKRRGSLVAPPRT